MSDMYNRKSQYQPPRHKFPIGKVTAVFGVLVIANILFWGGLLWAVLWILNYYGVI